jgi:hypothetical protein
LVCFCLPATAGASQTATLHTSFSPDHVHGKRVAFHPKGVSVPLHCPRGGFPFSANFSFLGGCAKAGEAGTGKGGEVLLRIFCHAHGQKIVLLLSCQYGL